MRSHGSGGHLDGRVGTGVARRRHDGGGRGLGAADGAGLRVGRAVLAAKGLVRGLVGEQQRRAAVARGGAAVLDALALDAQGCVLVGLAVELGDGDLGHVGLGVLDEGHGAYHVVRVAGVVGVNWALDHVELEDLASLGEEVLEVFLGRRWGQVADEHGAAITLAGGEECLVAGVAGGGAVLLEVEGGHGVHGILAEGLPAEVSHMPRS